MCSIVLVLLLTVGSGAGWQLVTVAKFMPTYDATHASKVAAYVWAPLYGGIGLYLATRSSAVLAGFSRNPFLAILTLLCFVSALWSETPFVSIYATIQIAALTLFGLSVPSTMSPRRFWTACTYAYTAVLLASLTFVVAIPTYGVMVRPVAGAWRGAFLDKNIMAQTAICCLCCYVPGLIAAARWRDRLGMLLLAVLALFVLYRSRTVSAFALGMLVIAVAALVVMIRGSVRSALVALAVASMAIGFAGIAWLVLPDLLATVGRDTSMTGRDVLWNYILAGIREYPLTGFGVGQFWSSSAPFGGAVLTRAVSWSPRSAHNSFLEVGAQLGIPGMALLLLATTHSIVAAVRIVFYGTGAYTIFPILLLLGNLGMGLVEANLFIQQSVFHLVFALACGAISLYAAALSPISAATPIGPVRTQAVSTA